MKFRNHRSLLDESMETLAEIEPTSAALRAHLEKTMEFFYRPELTLEVKPYCFDDRINWNTYIVILGGSAVGFTDGPIDGEPEVKLEGPLY